MYGLSFLYALIQHLVGQLAELFFRHFVEGFKYELGVSLVVLNLLFVANIFLEPTCSKRQDLLYAVFVWS